VFNPSTHQPINSSTLYFTGGNVATHKDLQIWQAGIDLVEQVYHLTTLFPQTEIYGLSSQMRRASVSVPSNIAEGAARRGEKEFVQFLYISLGSLSELETQCLIARRLGYVEDHPAFDMIEALRRKLLKFIRYLKER
jgi:four helix bundle protein